MLRPVTVFEYKWDGITEQKQKIEIGKGRFHGFGVSYEEFENGPGTYSTAIVEMPRGDVIMPLANMIRFDDNKEKNKLEG